MYFPFLELNGCGKRFAVQPKAICSEVPKKKAPGSFLPGAYELHQSVT